MPFGVAGGCTSYVETTNSTFTSSIRPTVKVETYPCDAAGETAKAGGRGKPVSIANYTRPRMTQKGRSVAGAATDPLSNSREPTRRPGLLHRLVIPRAGRPHSTENQWDRRKEAVDAVPRLFPVGELLLNLREG